MNTSNRREMLAAATVADPRWSAVMTRDRTQDGRFVYSVASTGIYFRPSCAARRPRPDNVGFHCSPAEAERAGFRPCRRCRPDLPSPDGVRAQWVAELCRMIERAERVPTLASLARQAGMSPHHLQRVFKAHVGLSPRQYAAGHRAKRLREGLDAGRSVTEAIHDAGFGSSSRFYERADEVLGMTPGVWRSGGANTEIRFATGQCSLGAILVAASERGVCAILLGDDPDDLARDLCNRFPRASLVGGDTAFEQTVAAVIAFVESPQKGIELPLDIRGTAFQQRVWQALREIPRGSTASYAEIAQRIGAPASVRAVAAACAANALAVAIPCHRVVRSDGSLAGYRWGVQRKRALLEREAALPD